MPLKKTKKFLGTSVYIPTQLSADFSSKDYGDKVIIKNSFKWNVFLLIGMIILASFLLTDISKNNDKWFTIIFCAAIVIYPVIALLDRSPVLTISAEGVLFKNKMFKKWDEITATKLDNSSESYNLRLHFSDNKSKTISLQDLTYSMPEICHIIEYFKLKSVE